MRKTRYWGDPKNTKVIVVGQDPYYQSVGELPNSSFYGDVYFKGKPFIDKELKKYNYAKAVYDLVQKFTNNVFADHEILLLDIHPIEPDPFPPKGKDPLISEVGVQLGFGDLKDILRQAKKLKYVFAMGPQVNRWLQIQGLYWSGQSFIEDIKGDIEKAAIYIPYYKLNKPEVFENIVGKTYSLVKFPSKCLVPIHHINTLEEILKDPEWAKKYDRIPRILGDTSERESYVVRGKVD